MKLEPKAKPVRIRIKSGGEDHFSLESLKQNFSVQDLWESVVNKSLSRWLKQQDEEDLAKKVDGFCKIKKPSANDYIRFSSLFFGNESFADADSLIKYYQSKELEKNLQYAFSYLFNSLNFESGKAFFDSLRQLKRNEEWIKFFEQRLQNLEDMEKGECHAYIEMLYEEQGEVSKAAFHKTKALKILVTMAKRSDELLFDLLETDDYQCIKQLYEDPEIRNKVVTDEWIDAFRRCKDTLLDENKGECLFILSTLYDDNQNKIMAKTSLESSADFGYQEAIKKLQPSAPRYPRIKEIHMSHGVSLSELPIIGMELWQLSKTSEDLHLQEAAHYLTCYHCINMFVNTQYNYYNTKPIKEDRNRISSFNSNEKPLVFLVAGLAWEEKTKGKEMYKDIGNYSFPDYFEKVFVAKRSNKEVVVTAKCGLMCNIVKDSIIEQMLFFMETFGEEYFFEDLN